MNLRNRTAERGMILMAALMFSLTVMAFAASVITSGVASNNQNRYLVAKDRAQDAAEAGVHHLLAALNGPQGNTIRAAGAFEGILQGKEGSKRTVNYKITFGPAGADFVDNDLDGAVDEPDEADMIEVISTGSCDTIRRTVRVTMLAVYRRPELATATYIADPLATLNFNGNSFLISGRDVDINGNETGVLTPGVGVAGDPSTILGGIATKSRDNIIGIGGTSSVYEVAPVDFDPLVRDGVRSATVSLPSGSAVKPDNPGDWGTIEDPQIVFGSGDIKISGGAVGAGILIIDGDLTISGNFEWRGLVIVRGNVTFSGGGGGKRLIGALVVERDVLGDGINWSSTNDDDLTISGTIDILFSNQTIARVTTVFATYSIINWREGPNPPEAAP
jgi:hypothetical protein